MSKEIEEKVSNGNLIKDSFARLDNRKLVLIPAIHGLTGGKLIYFGS